LSSCAAEEIQEAISTSVQNDFS